jgi:hypothetical protein
MKGQLVVATVAAAMLITSCSDVGTPATPPLRTAHSSTTLATYPTPPAPITGMPVRGG